MIKRSAACFLCAVIFSMIFAFGNTISAVESSSGTTVSSGRETKYHFDKFSEYSKDLTKKARPEQSITINGGEFFSSNKEAEISVEHHAGRDNVLLWKSIGGEITWRFHVATEGCYFLRITYYSLSENAQAIELGLKIDSNTPFFEAERLTLPKCFHSESEIKRDKNNNDVRPKQVSYNEWITHSANDNTGVSDDPYAFFLAEGEHTLTLSGSMAFIAIDTIEFYNEPETPSYHDYSAGAVPYGNSFRKMYEAEKPLYQSDKTLYPVYDRTSIDTSPSDPIKLRYNTIGQSNYSTHGQYIVWRVEAPEDGYYYLGARVRQNINTGTNSYRRLYVNGIVPFKEANAVKFAFNNRWQNYVFGGDTPWLIKLNRGENLLKLEVVSGDMTNTIAEMNELVNKVNDLYREIIMITGVSPDPYRDYHIDKEISNFNERVKSMSDKAQEVFDGAVKLGNSQSGNFNAITKLKYLLDTFLNKPSEIPNNISTLSSYASGISGLMTTVKSQPLELDTITVAGYADGLITNGKSFISSIGFGFKAFLGSFVEDYSSIGAGTTETNKQIEVWVSLGRDQAMVLKNLSDGIFTPQTGITANISIVEQSLIQASLSGMSPDVVLFVAHGDPVNLAMRGGLYPVSNFGTFNDVVSRFSKHAMDSYFYNGEYYAIPISESFPMMFYRIDILDSLNLEPPNTWEDMYKVIRVLQQNNLTVGIPNADSSNVMMVDTGIFATLLYQRGGKLYSNDFKSTGLNTEIGIDAFNVWTEFYKDYGLPNQFNFLNRFRSGDMPIGLSAYTFYGMLKQTAPEIDGLWEMALIPGTKNSDGSINRATCGTGTCAVIMRGSKNPKMAWEYIDWITNTETQELYGGEMEALLGATSRFTPANMEALSGLNWSAHEQQLIYKQWQEVFELPQIPGSYIVDRNLISAFRKVVYSSANPRETIVGYNNIIENEITRKRKEFNLD